MSSMKIRTQFHFFNSDRFDRDVNMVLKTNSKAFTGN